MGPITLIPSETFNEILLSLQLDKERQLSTNKACALVSKTWNSHIVKVYEAASLLPIIDFLAKMASFLNKKRNRIAVDRISEIGSSLRLGSHRSLSEVALTAIKIKNEVYSCLRDVERPDVRFMLNQLTLNSVPRDFDQFHAICREQQAATKMISAKFPIDEEDIQAQMDRLIQHGLYNLSFELSEHHQVKFDTVAFVEKIERRAFPLVEEILKTLSCDKGLFTNLIIDLVSHYWVTDQFAHARKLIAQYPEAQIGVARILCMTSSMKHVKKYIKLLPLSLQSKAYLLLATECAADRRYNKMYAILFLIKSIPIHDCYRFIIEDLISTCQADQAYHLVIDTPLLAKPIKQWYLNQIVRVYADEGVDEEAQKIADTFSDIASKSVAQESIILGLIKNDQIEMALERLRSKKFAMGSSAYQKSLTTLAAQYVHRKQIDEVYELFSNEHNFDGQLYKLVKYLAETEDFPSTDTYLASLHFSTLIQNFSKKKQAIQAMAVQAAKARNLDRLRELLDQVADIEKGEILLTVCGVLSESNNLKQLLFAKRVFRDLEQYILAHFFDQANEIRCILAKSLAALGAEDDAIEIIEQLPRDAHGYEQTVQDICGLLMQDYPLKARDLIKLLPTTTNIDSLLSEMALRLAMGQEENGMALADEAIEQVQSREVKIRLLKMVAQNQK